MLGPSIDYWILKPFTHSRNYTTEAELNARAARRADLDLASEVRRLRKLLHRLQGRMQITSRTSYLDIGCGSGGMAIALAHLGARHVTGVDLVPRQVAAAEAKANLLCLSDRVHFVCEDIHRWQPPHTYDVVLSHEALEHIREPERFLSTLTKLIEPDGVAVLAFGPLFHSPFGDHMDEFFRVPIPWRGVLFSEQALLRLRRESYRPTDAALRYNEVSGGLNLLRFSEFRKYAVDAGWTFDFLDVNPQLRRVPPLHWASRMLVRVPVVQDYFASSVYAILKRADEFSVSGLRPYSSATQPVAGDRREERRQ
jgi:SAM-dependent methyltransferase